MRSLVLFLITARILFGLWTGVSHAVHAGKTAPVRTALVIPR
jgi:hypothetical protein